MDPVSLTTAAVTLIAMCAGVVKAVKDMTEKFKGARTLLFKLLGQVERTRLYLEQLRSLTYQLRGRQSLLLPYNDSAVRQTLKELQDLVHDIVRVKVFITLQTVLNQKKSSELVDRLYQHQNDVLTVLMFITTYVFPTLSVVYVLIKS
jgi:hypothetical protein